MTNFRAVERHKFEKIEDSKTFDFNGYTFNTYHVRGQIKELGTKDGIHFYLWGQVAMDYVDDPYCIHRTKKKDKNK